MLSGTLVKDGTLDNRGVKFVTDVISTHEAATEALDGAPTAAESEPPTGEQPLAWAPNEPAPKKRRLGLWIGLGLGVVAIGAGAASMILIAPGTTVAGINVGWMTPGAANDAIESHLADTRITLTGAGDGTVLTGSDLGIALDGEALSNQAFAERPMWNLGAWMGEPIAGDITLDAATATSALRDAVPSSFVDPTDAGVTFDAASGTYVTTPAEAGTAIDVDALTAAIIDTVAAGGSNVEFSGDPTEAAAAVTDDDAATTAASLNTLLGTAGFYVGEERTVPLTADVVASWLTVTDEGGQLAVSADAAEIQKTVDLLPGIVDRAPVNASNIVDSAGNVLRSETEGVTGRTIGETTGIADDVAAKIEAGDGVFPLAVSEVPFESVNLYRHIDINLSSQTATLYENDQVVKSWLVSTGLPGTPTPTGEFKVFAHTRMQDMGCYEGAPYCTEDVPWITWFTTNIGFHGTYWHNNYGNRMSHGCVNLPIDLAKYVYDWSPVGLEVSVHN